KLGINSASDHFWTPKEEGILGKVSYAEAARRLGRTKKAVQHHRRQLGGAYFHPEKPHKNWTQAELALLGTQTDDVLAKKLGRTPCAIKLRRARLGIAAQRLNYRLWKPEEMALLGTMSDVAAARKLNRSVLAVRNKRFDSNIPPGFNRRWTAAEDKLLGKMP